MPGTISEVRGNLLKCISMSELHWHICEVRCSSVVIYTPRYIPFGFGKEIALELADMVSNVRIATISLAIQTETRNLARSSFWQALAALIAAFIDNIVVFRIFRVHSRNSSMLRCWI